MTELEKLAANAFEKFSLKKTGRKASWTYLSDERKVEWMCEMIYFIDHVNTHLKTKFKAPPKQAPNGGAYAAGYNDGIATERLSIMNFIEHLDKEYRKQLDQFDDVKEQQQRRSRLTKE